MSTLSLVKKTFTSPPSLALIANQYTREDLNRYSDGFWLFNQKGGMDYYFSYHGHASAIKAFETCAPLFSIISKKAQAYINGKTFILNKQGKAKDKESTSEIASKIRKLRAKPNPFQSEKEFDAQQHIYLDLFGFCIMLAVKPVGFPLTDATRLWNIPPYLLDIEETKRNFLLATNKGDVLKRVTLKFGEEQVNLPVEDLYIIKDINPSSRSVIFPESRVCSLEMQINNTIGAYESRNVLINYRGALGIISPDAKDVGGPVPLLDHHKQELQDEFLRYGLKYNQWKFIISPTSVKWSQMGVPTKDLMLFEEVEDDIMRMCDNLNYPYPLMASAKTNNLGGSSTDPNKRLLYQDAIIPEAENISEQWTSFFELEQYGLVLVKDYSHVPVLQEDKQKQAQARKTMNEARQLEFYNNVCTLNEWRVANGDDPLQGDYGDKYYWELVALGWSFGKAGLTLSDLQNNGSQNQSGSTNNQANQ